MEFKEWEKALEKLKGSSFDIWTGGDTLFFFILSVCSGVLRTEGDTNWESKGLGQSKFLNFLIWVILQCQENLLWGKTVWEY